MPGIKSSRWLSKPHSVECSQSGICGFEALAKISCCFNGVFSYLLQGLGNRKHKFK